MILLRGARSREAPRHELIEFLAGVSAGEALEGVGEPGERIDGAELGGLCRTANYAERTFFC